MNDIDRNLYAAIYDIVDKNYSAAGGKMSIDKPCYMTMAVNVPGTVNVLAMTEEQDNDRFLKTAYLSMLARQIDPAALENWAEYEDMPTLDFQHRVVNALKSSDEFFNTQIRLTNNVYSANNSFGGSLSGLKSSSSVSIPEKLMNTYRKMPEFMKKAARKVMGMK
ncbi:MAG: hypothetical protein J6L99_01375 [Ruminococcus sp.]|jgi:hypothetical protein|nr:hypothetical protein [Ruminococcus sp.]